MERYAVNKELGTGSFGKVFIVEAKSTGIQYVVKQIDLSRMDQRNKREAEKEVQVLAKMKHPNIVRYKEAYSDEKNLSIIMEVCELGDLHSLIQETRRANERLPDTQILEYFVQICLALQYIHEQKVLHRDLKTKNIFLKKGNVIKLGDFGVAKVLDNSFDLAETCIGSPIYISPEICENKPYDKKSDIWALGCVLFEMTTLRYAFIAKNMKALITKITTGDHADLPSNTNVRIRHTIKKLLNLEPKSRPTAAEVLTWPFISSIAGKLNGQSRQTYATKSDKLANNLIFKTSSSKSVIPISKCSVNLCTSDITEPETKYKSGSVTPKNRPKPTRQGSVGKLQETKIKKEPTKLKKLPKSDSLYYSMIEENNKRLDRPATFIENVLKVSNITEKNFEEKIGNLSKENERKQWAMATADQRQLVSYLSEADLVETFASECTLTETVFKGKETSSIAADADLLDLSDIPQARKNLKCLKKEVGKQQPSIDDLLSMTVDISHLPILEPERVWKEQEPRSEKLENWTTETFSISSQPTSVFEELEKRRVSLERRIGLVAFMKVYKMVEECGNEELKIKMEEGFKISEILLGEVRELVRDERNAMTD